MFLGVEHPGHWPIRGVVEFALGQRPGSAPRCFGGAVSAWSGDGRPLVETLSGSRYPNMKELRVGTLRVLFALNPLRDAVLLLGGNKRGRWNLWYKQAIPTADDLYSEHLTELRDQGQIP